MKLKVIVALSIMVVSTTCLSAPIFDGIKGLKIGMSKAELDVPLNKLGNLSVDKLKCFPGGDDFGEGITSCGAVAPGFTYANVPVQMLLMNFVNNKLEYVYVSLAVDAGPNGLENTYARVSDTLLKNLPAPVHSDATSASWVFANNAFGIQKTHIVSVLQGSPLYEDLVKAKKAKDALALAKAKDADK